MCITDDSDHYYYYYLTIHILLLLKSYRFQYLNSCNPFIPVSRYVSFPRVVGLLTFIYFCPSSSPSPLLSIKWRKKKKKKKKKKKNTRWVYYPGHAGVKRNYRASRPAGKAAMTRGLCTISENVKSWGARTLSAGTVKGKDINPPTSWRRKAKKEKAVDDLPWTDQEWWPWC